MIDIHCHILPGIDDGSQSWEMTAEMCAIAAEDGTTHIVATPHANDDYAYDRNRFTEMLGQLHDAADGKLSFTLGCDFHLSHDNVRDALANPCRYTIGETQYLLVEFSDYGIPPSVEQDIFSLRSCGLVPVITHPERNQPLRKAAGDGVAADRAGLPGASHGRCGDRRLGQPVAEDGGMAAAARGGPRDRQRCA